MPDQGDNADSAPDESPSPIAARLRRVIRILGGMTSAARQTGLSPNTIYGFLKGREMRLEAVITLAHAAQVSVEWLATGSEAMTADLGSIPVEIAGWEEDAAALKHRHLPDWSHRIRRVVHHLGGVIPAAEKTGIPQRSLYNLMSGQAMRVGPMVALASAAGVSVEWLATGGTRPPAAAELPTTPPPPAEPPAPPAGAEGLFELVDVPRLARAIEFVENSLRRTGSTISTEERARAFLLAYDLSREHEDKAATAVNKSLQPREIP